jgi:hypothetical protein
MIFAWNLRQGSGLILKGRNLGIGHFYPWRLYHHFLSNGRAPIAYWHGAKFQENGYCPSFEIFAAVYLDCLFFLFFKQTSHCLWGRLYLHLQVDGLWRTVYSVGSLMLYPLSESGPSGCLLWPHRSENSCFVRGKNILGSSSTNSFSRIALFRDVVESPLV